MERIDWQKILNLLLKISFWAALAVVPLGMSFFFPVYSPFNLVKTFWLQVLGSIALALFIVINRPWQPSFLNINRRPWLRAITPVWVFFFAWTVITLFSSNIVQSWFGSYERHLGLLSLFWLCVWYSLIVFYFSGVFVKTKTGLAFDWSRAVKNLSAIASLVGGLIGIYAFLQFVGLDFAVWQEAQLNSRAISTLGQPNFLGSFLLLTIPLSVYLYFSYDSFRARAIVALLGAWQLVGLLVSGSRAAWLAFMLVLGLAAVIFAWRKFGKWSLLIAGAVVAGALFLFYLAAPSRLTSLLDFNNGSTALRRLFYQSAIGAIAEKPWLGVGLENGGEAMVAYYRPEWGIFMNADGYTDKVHNSLLDAIIQTGLVGFVFYAGLYLFFGWQCWLLWRKQAGRYFAFAAASSLLAYSVSILFGLADVASIFYVWLIAAFVAAGNISLQARERERIVIKYSRLQRLLILIAGAGMMAACLAQVYLSINTLQADYYYLQLQYLRPQKKYYSLVQIYSYLEQTALNPVNRAYYQRALSSYAVFDYDALPDLSSKRLVRQLVLSIKNDLPRAGYENALTHARLNCFLEKSQAAAGIYDGAIARSPYRPLGYRERAACLVDANNLTGALADYDAALSLLPSINDARLNRDHAGYVRYYAYNLWVAKARIFDMQQDDESALTSYRYAYSYFPEDVSTLRFVAGRLERLGRNDEAEAILKHAFMREPQSADWPLALAGFYQRSNNKEMALEYARQASALSPYIDLEPFSN